MDFLVTEKVPFLSYLLSITSRYSNQMMDSPFVSRRGKCGNFKSSWQSTSSRLGYLGIISFHLYSWALIIRMLCMAVSLNSQGALLPDYLYYDLYLNFLRKINLLDGHLAAVGWPSLLLGSTLDFTARFIRQTYCYRLSHDLIIVNRKNFFTLNPHLLQCGLKSFFRQLLTEHSNLVLNCPKLLYFPYLSRAVRLRAVALSMTFDLLTAFSSVAFGLQFTATILHYYLTQVWWAYPVWQSSLIALEGTVITYMIWHSIQISFVLVHALYLILYVHIANQRELNRLLDSSTAKMKMRQRQLENEGTATTFQPLSSTFFNQFSIFKVKKAIEAPDQRPNGKDNIGSHFLLPFYLRSHLRFIKDLLTMNREFFSPLILVTLMTMFGGNVYSVTMIVLKQLNFFVNSLLLVIIGTSSFFLTVAVRPAVIAASTLASASKHLYKAQSYLVCRSYAKNFANKGSSVSGVDVRLKMKVATYFEVLTSGEKIAFAAGSIGKITNESIAQFLFFYTGYIIFSMNLSLTTLK